MLLRILKNNNEDDNEFLHLKSKQVSKVTPELLDLAKNMAETMYLANGIGLAAPQVGKDIEMFIFDISPERSDWQVLFNPEIIERSESMIVGQEACLSVPDKEAEVMRHKNIVVKALNKEGKEVFIDAEGTPAVVMQHEIDHLLGTLYTERAIPGTIKKAENFDV